MAKSSSVSSDITLWKTLTQEWYPDLLTQTHFLPAVHMNRTQCEAVHLSSGLDVLQTVGIEAVRAKKTKNTLSSSDTRDDECQQKVLRSLKRLHKEAPQVMFVLSQLEFVNYLCDADFSKAAATPPRPCDLKAENDHRGDFDVLIIHRDYGIVVAEIKAIGDQMGDLPLKQQREKMSKKLELSIKQLHKAERVLKHLLKDLPTQPRVLKTLMLPNAWRSQLQDVLKSHPSTAKALCECLEAQTGEDPAFLCMTADDVIFSDCPCDVTGPHQWWKRRVTDSCPDPSMTDVLYLDIVSRFGGPATSVKVFCSSVPRLASHQKWDVRTVGEGVEEIGNRYTPVSILLHPQQVEVLNDDTLTNVFLTGPPGTGKTLLLQLKAREWLHKGHHVYIISSWKESLRASRMLVHQLKQTTDANQRILVHLYRLELDDADAMNSLLDILKKAAQSQQGRLFVIMDELFDYDKQVVRDFFNQLCSVAPSLSLWAASQYFGIRPDGMTLVTMQKALRTPPSVTHEVRQCQKMHKSDYVLQYEDSSTLTPLPADGLEPVTLIHEGQGHSEDQQTYDCVLCGKNVAAELRKLNVGGKDRSSTSPKALQYRDVFVLMYHGKLHDDEEDENGHIVTEASGFIQGLRQEGFPVKVLREEDIYNVKEEFACSINKEDANSVKKDGINIVSSKDKWKANERDSNTLGIEICTDKEREDVASTLNRHVFTAKQESSNFERDLLSNKNQTDHDFVKVNCDSRAKSKGEKILGLNKETTGVTVQNKGANPSVENDLISLKDSEKGAVLERTHFCSLNAQGKHIKVQISTLNKSVVDSKPDEDASTLEQECTSTLKEDLDSWCTKDGVVNSEGEDASTLKQEYISTLKEDLGSCIQNKVVNSQVEDTSTLNQEYTSTPKEEDQDSSTKEEVSDSLKDACILNQENTSTLQEDDLDSCTQDKVENSVREDASTPKQEYTCTLKEVDLDFCTKDEVENSEVEDSCTLKKENISTLKEEDLDSCTQNEVKHTEVEDAGTLKQENISTLKEEDLDPSTKDEVVGSHKDACTLKQEYTSTLEEEDLDSCTREEVENSEVDEASPLKVEVVDSQVEETSTLKQAYTSTLKEENLDTCTQDEVATMTGPNVVVVAQSFQVNGLERKVVVWVQADGWSTENEDRGRQQAMSRCTAQLIWVKPPIQPDLKICFLKD